MATPLVYGHRGASAAAPENTLEAFELARSQGADGVELDVRRSADGVLVLNHDAVLPDGRVIRATAHDELPPAMPTLAAALDVCVGMLVNVEIKNIPYEVDFDPDLVIADDVAALLARRDDDVLVSSFHLATIDRVRALDPTVPTALLTMVDPMPVDSLARVVAHGHVAINPWDPTVDDALVAAAHDAGLSVNVWTVDDPERIVVLAGYGVDGIVTNVPDLAGRVLRYV